MCIAIKRFYPKKVLVFIVIVCLALDTLFETVFRIGMFEVDARTECPIFVMFQFLWSAV